MRTFRLATVASLAITPAMALSQQPDSLPRVIITATRVDTTLGRNISASSVIDRAAIERSGARDVAELLRLVPGISIARSGGPGAQSSLFLRGGESDYVRVLIDGVQVNDPGGAIDLAWLSVDDVERIEVVRGPASVLYGTDAVTGVIQLFTRRGTDPTAAGEIAGGSYGHRIVRGNVAGGSSRLNFTVGAASESSDGVLEFNSDYSRDVLSAALQSRPSSRTRIEASLRAVNDEYHYPTDGAGAVVDRNAFRDNQRLIGTVSFAQRFAERVRGELSLSLMNSSGKDNDQQDSPADTTGFYYYDALTEVSRRTVDARVHLMLTPSSVLTIGGELVRELQEGNDSSNFSFERSDFDENRHNGAVYAQWLAEHGPFSMTVGGRYDDNNTFGSFSTARAGIAWRAWRGGTLRLTGGNAFKAPTFYETFNTAFSFGNPDLVPERSRSWEAGIRQESSDGRLAIGATWFDQRFRDMIQFAYLNSQVPNYFNVAAASARGLELDGAARISPKARVDATTTLLSTRVDDAGLQSGDDATFVEGNRLLRRPPIVSTVSLAFDVARNTTAGLSLTYTGERDDRDFSSFPATPVVLPAWTRVDVSLTQPLAFGWSRGRFELVARVENLFGAGYEEIVNYPAPGRSLTIGLRAASLRR